MADSPEPDRELDGAAARDAVAEAFEKAKANLSRGGAMGGSTDNPTASGDDGQSTIVVRRPMWPYAPLPPQLQEAVDAWLKSNRSDGADVYHGVFPLGMVTNWIERAKRAEAKLLERAQ